jgi:glycosyltransferase involved in cell wall biosynthesis
MASPLIFVSRRPPHPAESGAPIRTHRLLTGLAREFDTTFVTYAHDADGYELHCPRDELERAVPGVEIVMVPGIGGTKRLAQARSLLSRHSWEWAQYRRPALARALSDLHDRRRPGLVHFDDIGVAQVGPLAGPVNVLSPHGVEQWITRGIADASSGVRRVFAEIEWRKVAREERAVWRAMDVSLALSEEEADAMRAGGAGRVELCPNGTDEHERLPPPAKSADEPLRLLFVGTGRFQPNERGLAWFVRDVLPRVRRTTAAQLDVVGEPPERPVEVEGVVYHGRVPEVQSWYTRAHAVIVPLFEGAGTRLKVVEAAALGRPIVATRFGPAGLPLAAGQHFLDADEPDAFAGRLTALAAWLESGEPRLEAMLAAARTAVEPLFWPRIASELAETYRSLMAEAREPRHPLVRT